MMPKHMLLFWAAMGSILICGIVIYLLPQSTAAPQATVATVSPAAPVATATPWLFQANTTIGTVDISGLTEAQAYASLSDAFTATLQPLQLYAGDATFTIEPHAIAAHIPLHQLISQARQQTTTDASVHVPLLIEYDRALLHTELEQLAVQVAVAPTLGYSATLAAFVLTPGQKLDLQANLDQVQHALQTTPAPQHLELKLQPDTTLIRPTTAQLEAALQQREAAWNMGIIGVAVIDMTTGEQFGYHQDTVFSGMSVLKVGILLQAFIQQAEFSAGEYVWIDRMLRISDNWSANRLLDIAGEGDGLMGVERMNATLRSVLGLEYTRMTAPFESIEYLTQFVGLEFPMPGPEGAEPYIDADPYVRATPAEVATLFQALVDCANNTGALLEMQATQLSPARCEEMLYLMSRSRDINKIVSGVPRTAFVSHKSGWIEDTRADAGYVHTKSGLEYVVSIWIWSPEGWIETAVSDPLLADLSRIVYTSFQPIVLDN